MRDGFVSVAAVTPHVTVAGIKENTEEIKSWMDLANEEKVDVCVFPELCITGFTCGDLFYSDLLLRQAKEALLELAKYTKNLNGIFFVGLPFSHKGKIYNVAAALNKGEILGLVPKTNLPNYGEFYEARQFTPGKEDMDYIEFGMGQKNTVCLGTKQYFRCAQMENLVIGAEICEDLWVPNPPSVDMALNGATLIVNLSASDELTGKRTYRRSLVEHQSASLYCGYVYASAGIGESTQDVVYSGHSLICENGVTLMESEPFEEGMVISEIDVNTISFRRRTMNTFLAREDFGVNESVFELEEKTTELSRFVDPKPFVPSDEKQKSQRCEEILDIQSYGLRKRLDHTGCKTAVIGISGGLDSTLALLVTARAFDLLELDHKGIIAVTMPGFGTTDRTYQNALSMIRELHATLKEVDICPAVLQHFKDIGQNESDHDVTYENSQARERTQILMDIANKENGMVIGTGDLSELALGWATYNGDHMSMYGVNTSVPKTLVRHLVKYYADACCGEALQKVLYDVLDTPVSPELLPPKDGVISQKTEELVGPYELHDFFLYHLVRLGQEPGKIYRLAKIAFEGEYDGETIKKWLKTFLRRFFSQQFKRSCLPDGPKVGTVALSPRGDWRMPSDGDVSLWIEALDCADV